MTFEEITVSNAGIIGTVKVEGDVYWFNFAATGDKPRRCTSNAVARVKAGKRQQLETGHKPGPLLTSIMRALNDR